MILPSAHITVTVCLSLGLQISSSMMIPGHTYLLDAHGNGPPLKSTRLPVTNSFSLSLFATIVPTLVHHVRRRRRQQKPTSAGEMPPCDPSCGLLLAWPLHLDQDIALGQGEHELLPWDEDPDPTAPGRGRSCCFSVCDDDHSVVPVQVLVGVLSRRSEAGSTAPGPLGLDLAASSPGESVLDVN